MKIFKKVISSILLTPIVFSCFISCSGENGKEIDTSSDNKNTVSVVAVTASLKRGEVLSAKDVTVVEADSKSIPENYLVKRGDAIGRVLLTDVAAGDILSDDLLIEKADPNLLRQDDVESIKAELREQLLSELRHEIASGGINASDLGYVIVTDYVQANTGKDVSDEIQQVIDSNPQKTIFFPDGEYILGKPICTSANPKNAVSLELSNFAILKAADGWSHTEAMVRLGGAEAANNIYIVGSNYSLSGGVIDGNKLANGISIDSGRETSIYNTSIKNTQIGIHIKNGANNGSSDADIYAVNIVGNNMPDSIGVLIEGADNTLENMRIAAVQTGVLLRRAGNSLRDIHPLFIFASELSSKNQSYSSDDLIDFTLSIAFDDQTNGANLYDFCYSDQMATGFRFGSGESIFQNCLIMWYTPQGRKQVAFECTDKFNASIKSATVYFKGDVIGPAFLKVKTSGGYGKIEDPYFNPYATYYESYKDYLVGKVRNPNA